MPHKECFGSRMIVVNEDESCVTNEGGQYESSKPESIDSFHKRKGITSQSVPITYLKYYFSIDSCLLNVRLKASTCF